MIPVSSPSSHPQAAGRLSILAEGRVGSPRVSGDGSTVVWNEVRGEVTQIMRHRAGQAEQVTTGTRPAIHPDLSADGDVVVWDQLSTENLTDPGANWDVYELRRGQVSAVAEGPANQGSARVSRDGSTVAWDDDGDGRMSRFNIHVSKNGVEEAVTRGPGARMFPVLSGDGGRVLWRDFNGSSSDLWMRDEAGVTKPVVTTDSEQITPQISPDGKTLLWTDTQEGDEDVFLWKDGRIGPVAGERGVDETWATMSADGTRVVWTDFDFRKGTPARVQVLMRDEEGVKRVDRDKVGLGSYPVISDDGRTIVWMWQDADDINTRRIYRLDLDPPSGG